MGTFVGSILAIAEKSSMNGFGTSGGLVHRIRVCSEQRLKGTKECVQILPIRDLFLKLMLG